MAYYDDHQTYSGEYYNNQTYPGEYYNDQTYSGEYYNDQTYSGEYYNDQTNSGEYYNNQASESFVPQNYEPSIYNLFDYEYNFSSFSSSHSITTAYSTFTPSQPNHVQYYYNPNCHQLTVTTSNTHYYDQTPQTQPLKSSVVSGFNAPEFDEYDSTPYGGGYDIVQTYGRPLSPSDQTCYPLPGTRKKKKVTFADDQAKPEKPPTPQPEKRPTPPPEKPGAPPPEKKKDEAIGRVECDDQPEIVSQIPSGYGLEAMDLCESLFGFWPCHTRYYAERGNGYFACCHGYGCGCDGRGAVVGAADYLFGGCDPYVERRDGGGSFGQPIHCYDKRYREHPLSVEVEFDHHQYDHRLDDQEGDSWSQSFRIF